MATRSFTVHGTAVVDGCAYAPALWVEPRPVAPADTHALPEDARRAEVDRFLAASAVVVARLNERAEASDGFAAELLHTTATLAQDRGWVLSVIRRITAGTSAEAATRGATQEFVEALEKVGGLMAERTADLRDIRDRITAELMGLPEPGLPTPTEPVVLLADELAPVDAAQIDPALVVAVCTRLGGPTSHTSIIARQLGIPCVVGVENLRQVGEGVLTLVDGDIGSLTVGADPVHAQSLVEADAERRRTIRAWQGPGRLADGTPIVLQANVQDGADARTAAAGVAEGVGLFRTEMHFLSATSEPSIEAQAALYGEVFEAFAGRPVVVRTLDAGSDKPVPFARHDDEENPALGVRGLRLRHTNPGLLLRQLDAIALAAERVGVERTPVMAPMVSEVAEATVFAEACRERGLSPGVMVEVPSVALLADEFLAQVDFFSIGTNDLAQYAMAADRLSSPLAHLTSPWQPAVLKLIAMTADAGRRAGKLVGVCGEAAAEPLLACVLVGLGVTSLSMASPAIPAVGAQLASVTRDQCRAAARVVLQASDAAHAKDAARVMLGTAR